jgi:enoyl-CoA hydratase/carnithine racemase
MSRDGLNVETDGGIAVITLNRPDKLNSLTPPMMTALGIALDEIHADRDIRAAVVTGAGHRAFSTGFDLDGLEMATRTDAIVDSTRANFETLMKVWNLRVPVIAAVNGFAVAAGMSLALICDITIAAESASFGEPEVRHFALSPLLLMPWLANNPKMASYLYYSGDTIPAAQAKDLGFVSEVVPDAQLTDRAMAIARRIAMVPPFAVEMTKESLRRSYEIMGFSSALQQHRLLDTLLLASHGIPERDHFFDLMAAGDMRAFLAARDGQFKQDQAGDRQAGTAPAAGSAG